MSADIQSTSAPRAEIALGIAMVTVVAVMLLPVPPLLLDLMLSLSVSLSLVVFLFALHIERPLEFSAFPSILLLLTLVRLALNVASTRLILLHGDAGVAAAGHVIEAFGAFVVGGNTVVGVIVFVILVVINFVVVSKGSGRIAEVAARFTLDSMPGKQMAIDADLAAGLCTDTQARQRRRAVEQEADFFGSMDGAGKFVRGDAVAGLLITGVNIVGGLVVGILQHHMPALQALQTYTSLTVGDGLVSQIPALLTSVAAGLVTTRASAGGSLGLAVGAQIFGNRNTLGLTSGVLALLALVPGMPHLAFFVLAAVFAGLGLRPRRSAPDASTGDPTPASRTPEMERAELESLLPLDLLQVEVGYELIALVDSKQDGALIARIAGLRRQLAQDLGLIVPPVHMRDNLRLRPSAYRVLLSGNVIGSGALRPSRLMAIGGAGITGQLPGEAVVEPAFNLPARWIEPSDRQRAELMGYTVVDPATVVTTHLGELLAEQAPDLLGRREVQELLELHGRVNGRVVEELIPGQLSTAALVRVLQNLLRERISIRDFRSILEALADHVGETKEPDLLTERVRQRLAKQLTHRHTNAEGKLSALVLAPAVEATFRRMQGTGGTQVVEPEALQRLVGAFEAAAERLAGQSQLPVILTAADVRRAVATFAARYLPQLAVLSFRELDAKVSVNTLDVIGQGQTQAPAPGRRAALGPQQSAVA